MPQALLPQVTESASPYSPAYLNQDQIVFAGYTGTDSSASLFVSNGTASGTTAIFTGPSVTNLLVSNGTIYFTTRNDHDGEDLWRSDGTAAHTERVQSFDVYVGSLTAFQDNSFHETRLSITLWNSDLYISDGTAEGTTLVPWQGTVVDVNAGHLISLNEIDYPEILSSYDIQSGKTVKLQKQRDLTFLGTFDGQDFFTSSAFYGDQLNIFATNGVVNKPDALELSPDNGYKGKSYADHLLLYPTDYTTDNTTPLWYVRTPEDGEFNPSPEFTEFPIYDLLSADPANWGSTATINWGSVRAEGNFIYLMVDYANDTATYSEVWRTDGTTAGTQRVISGDTDSSSFRVIQTGNTTFLQNYTDTGQIGYQVHPDGSLTPTELFDYITDRSDVIGVVSGQVLFRHTDDLLGSELYALPLDNPIVVQPIANAMIDENQPWTLQASATIEQGTLVYSLVTGSENGIDIDPATGLISWTPTEANGGSTYQVTVRAALANDPTTSAQTSFTVRVNEVNAAPALQTIAAQTLSEGKDWSLQAVATDPDTPAQKLTYALTGSVPDGLTINPATGMLHWTPGELQGGLSATITVKVTDNGSPALSATRSFNVVVAEVNAAPVLAAIADQTITAGTKLSLKATATDSDAPAQTLSFALTGTVPAGLTIDPKTGGLSWTPGNTQGGQTHSITVQVTDNGSPALSATQTFKITVITPNSPPVIAPIANQSVKEGQPLSLKVIATDADAPAQKLTYKLVGAVPAGASIDPTTGQFQWKPAYKAASATFTVEVADDAPVPAKTQKQFLVTVKPNPIAARFATVFNTKKQFTGLNIVFNDNVDAVSSQKLSAYKLVTAGKDKKFGTKDDVVVKLKSVKLQSDGKTILLTPSASLSKTTTYQLSVLDTVLDTYGRPMDGDNDGQFGGPAVTNITKGLIG